MAILVRDTITAFDIRKVYNGDKIIVTHKGVEKYAIVSLEDLNLLRAETMDEIEDKFDIDLLKDQ